MNTNLIWAVLLFCCGGICFYIYAIAKCLWVGDYSFILFLTIVYIASGRVIWKLAVEQFKWLEEQSKLLEQHDKNQFD